MISSISASGLLKSGLLSLSLLLAGRPGAHRHPSREAFSLVPALRIHQMLNSNPSGIPSRRCCNPQANKRWKLRPPVHVSGLI